MVSSREENDSKSKKGIGVMCEFFLLSDVDRFGGEHCSRSVQPIWQNDSHVGECLKKCLLHSIPGREKWVTLFLCTAKLR